MKLLLSSAAILLALTSQAFANHSSLESEKLYIGVFGGGGASDSFNANQFGTAYFIEADGGPLAVNAFGRLGSESSGFFGAQLGYQAKEICPNHFSRWTLGPATELEWYSMSHKSFSGTLVNDTDRLAEHDFIATYPMSRNLFLVNAVLNFNTHSYPVQPYIGLGVGSAIVRISNASATQINPPEAGVNHYNANPSATDTTFAGQIKIGLGYNFNKYFSVFADYRWLYIASSDFTFGSTVFPGHPATSSWQVTLDAQRYNLGTIGIRFSL